MAAVRARLELIAGDCCLVGLSAAHRHGAIVLESPVILEIRVLDLWTPPARQQSKCRANPRDQSRVCTRGLARNWQSSGDLLRASVLGVLWSVLNDSREYLLTPGGPGTRIWQRRLSLVEFLNSTAFRSKVRLLRKGQSALKLTRILDFEFGDAGLDNRGTRGRGRTQLGLGVSRSVDTRLFSRLGSIA